MIRTYGYSAGNGRNDPVFPNAEEETIKLVYQTMFADVETLFGLFSALYGFSQHSSAVRRLRQKRCPLCPSWWPTSLCGQRHGKANLLLRILNYKDIGYPKRTSSFILIWGFDCRSTPLSPSSSSHYGILHQM